MSAKTRLDIGPMPASPVMPPCSRLNLASFVTTWMEPEAEKLIMESLDVNYVNTEEVGWIREIIP